MSILVELADFYDVDIREIINGERKSEDVNQEEKEKMMLVAEYAEDEKKILLKRFGVVSIIGLCSMIVGIAMLALIGYNSLPVTDFIIGAALGLAFTALVVAVLYSTGVLAKIMKIRNKPLNKALFIIAISVTIIFLIFLVESF
ncbi:MAG: transcriptional regulator [Ruminococcus sp.]|nr:transcriptional regulator [Ruminococcus sp.]